MKQVELADIQQLVRQIILPFYQIKRDLPLPIQNHRNENDAEHCWSLALLGLALAPRLDSSLDTGKVVTLALVHDLVEIHAGDTSVWADQKHHETKAEREAKALAKLERDFPNFPSVTSSIHEYEQLSTNEACFVYALDKLIPLLLLFEDKGYYYHTHLGNRITKDQFDKQFIDHRRKAHKHPMVAKYYDELHHEFAAHPEFFHSQNSK